MICQLRFPVARSPNAFMNSLRAATKGLTSRAAGGAVPTQSEPRERPRRSSMNWGRRMATRSPMRRMARSAQGAEGMRDAEARMTRQASRDDMRHPDRKDREDERPAHHLEQRARGAEK